MYDDTVEQFMNGMVNFLKTQKKGIKSRPEC